MSAMLQQAMDTLSVRCNTTHLHPTDEDTIKSFLKALHKHGEDINPVLLKTMATAHDWDEEPIKQLVKWAEAITGGGRVVIKHKQFVQTDKQIIAHLKARIAETATA